MMPSLDLQLKTAQEGLAEAQRERTELLGKVNILEGHAWHNAQNDLQRAEIQIHLLSERLDQLREAQTERKDEG